MHFCAWLLTRVKSKKIFTRTRPESTNMAMTPTGVPKKTTEKLLVGDLSVFMQSRQMCLSAKPKAVTKTIPQA